MKAYSLASGDESHHHVGIGQVGRAGHEDGVGQRHQAAAEADRGPVDRGDHGRPAPDHVEHQPPAGVERDPAQRGVAGEVTQIAEVAPGREGPPAAGEHDGPHVAGSGQVRTHLRSAADDKRRGVASIEKGKRLVEIVGPVEPDDADRAVGVDPDLVGHVVGGVCWHGHSLVTRSFSRSAVRGSGWR